MTALLPVNYVPGPNRTTAMEIGRLIRTFRDLSALSEPSGGVYSSTRMQGNLMGLPLLGAHIVQP
jgi:hypothetical protein